MEFDSRAAGRAIRSLRRERGLSQEVLSGFAGIARTHLTMIGNGTEQADFETIMNKNPHRRLSRAAV